MLVTLQDVQDARRRLAHVLRPTALWPTTSIASEAGRKVLLKPEQLQRTGSFKARGAYNHVSRLPAGAPVVAASAGNHAQGVALAASLTGRSATIFMPATTPLPKVEATRSYGADVRLAGEVVDDSMEAAQAFADESGAVYVHPFDHPLVVAGQGTVGLEIAEAAEVPDDAVVVVPVGGGGLVSGIAAALAHTRRSVRVVGAEAEGAASMTAALAARRPVVIDKVATMADGIATRSVCQLTLAHVQAYVDDVVTVGEEEISRALLLLLERAKAVVEPAGAVALAAVLAGRVPGRGPVVAVVSGGNVDPLLLIKLIDHGLSVAGRYLILRVVLGDRPGELARLAGEVGRRGLNVLSVEHHRSGVLLGVNEVEVQLTLETRDPAHRHEVVGGLASAGFRVELVR